ncbi:MAG TPA: hypothetical protein VGR07_03610, partial [Thermoanaerobaculia bacterium]|nr:hypothetical protein [Thermoanaerobaculia bacterium]
LVLVTGVCLARGIGLARDPHRLAAHEERTWLAWAYPRSDAAALFARAASSLAPGEVVCLQVPRDPRLDWYRYMANYYLPDQGVAAVRHRGAARSFPSQATVVTITGTGDVRVRRGGHLGQPG